MQVRSLRNLLIELRGIQDIGHDGAKGEASEHAKMADPLNA